MVQQRFSRRLPVASTKRLVLMLATLLLTLVVSVQSLGSFYRPAYDQDPVNMDYQMLQQQQQHGGPSFQADGKGFPMDFQMEQRGHSASSLQLHDSSDDLMEDEDDFERMTTHQFLERHGLGLVAKQLSKFITLFDTSTHLFSKLNDDEQFNVLNRVLNTFLKSYVLTVQDLSNSKDALVGGEISFSAMKDFIVRQESHFNGMLKSDPKILQSEWSQFLVHTHVLFDSFKDIYQSSLDNGLPLRWWMLKMTGPLVDSVPTNLLDRSTFASLLSAPAELQHNIHQMLESVLTSQYGPMIKMAAQFASTYMYDRRDEL